MLGAGFATTRMATGISCGAAPSTAWQLGNNPHLVFSSASARFCSSSAAARAAASGLSAAAAAAARASASAASSSRIAASFSTVCLMRCATFCFSAGASSLSVAIWVEAQRPAAGLLALRRRWQRLWRWRCWLVGLPVDSHVSRELN